MLRKEHGSETLLALSKGVKSKRCGISTLSLNKNPKKVIWVVPGSNPESIYYRRNKNGEIKGRRCF